MKNSKGSSIDRHTPRSRQLLRLMASVNESNVPTPAAKDMKIKIGRFDITECWDGVFYKKLSDYPHVTDWEIQTVLDFIHYEEANGRTCPMEAEESIRSAIRRYRPTYEKGVRTAPPSVITECTACPKYKGCLTDFVCHTSPLEAAVKILNCGRLLSPVKARGKPGTELQKEARNAANDPADYFDYIMFAWGNCQAGDRLVTERALGRFPAEEDLRGNFTPGVRFFFRYKTLVRHPNATFEGVLPLKVKDEIVLKDWVHAVVAPESYRQTLEAHIPPELKPKVHFVKKDGEDIWQWAEKVYEFTKNL